MPRAEIFSNLLRDFIQRFFGEQVQARAASNRSKWLVTLQAFRMRCKELVVSSFEAIEQLALLVYRPEIATLFGSKVEEVKKYVTIAAV